MANAELAAPSKKEKKFQAEDAALEQLFDIDKKYMFELAEENPEREYPVIDMITKRPAPHKKFKPYRNLVMTSQIVWKGQRKIIRYYDGCESLFIDEQPKDKDVIDQLIRQTKRREFLDGKMGVYGDERQLLIYLNICSWNTESPFRTKTATQIFKPVNADKIATLESNRLDLMEEALKLAKGASDTKMRIHASYIGIPTIDYDSGNELSEKEIRTAYRKEASRNPEGFIKDYGNKSIEVKHFVKEALRKGLINNNQNPNKAVWAQAGTEICDVSGLKSHDAIADRLFEFSQSDEGEEFLIQLKNIFN